MPYSRDEIVQFKTELPNAIAGSTALAFRYVGRAYTEARAREYATHGFSRRLYTLHRCIERVFSITPPSRKAIFKGKEAEDAMIYIQAFIFNTFGCLDNLAWIWVAEERLKIERRHVGLGPQNKTLRDALPAVLADHLRSFDNWFAHLEDFRHALAHRIPLYVPPFIRTPEQVSEAEGLEAIADKARLASDSQTYFTTKSKLLKVGQFEPMMLHSLDQGSRPIRYHYQLLTDLNTVTDIGDKLLVELEARHPSI